MRLLKFTHRILLLLMILISVSSMAQIEQIAEREKGQIIVMLKLKSDVNLVCQDLNKYTAGEFQPVSRLSQSLNLWTVSYNENIISAKDALEELEKCKETQIAQFNHTNLVMRSIPNDTLFYRQWNFNNDGTNGGAGSADIDAPLAWDISTGGQTLLGDTIVVAVIDGGFDIDHVDLFQNIFKNSNEIAGNSIDDDGNGFVDDIRGWDFYNNDPDHPMDSHGTHVAGTIGAKGNNQIGVAGINWNIKLLPITGSSTLESTVVAAYGYVLDMRKAYNQSNGEYGAYVVATNSSFGVDYGQPSEYPLWCAMYDSMGVQGVLSAGATINNNINVDEEGDIPTACASNFLISVTNTTSEDFINQSSGYGPETIDIGAPGTNIFSLRVEDNYGLNSGTSMATPHVAGAIGLMYSVICPRLLDDYSYNPGGLALLVRNRLLNQGVNYPSALNGLVSSNGRLNLNKAMKSMIDSCLYVKLNATNSSCGACDGSIQAEVFGASGNLYYLWSNSFGGGPYQSNLCPGYYTVTVIDAANDSSISSIAISDSGAPELDIQVTGTICPNQNSGSISISGGFNYSWLDGGSSASRTGLGSGVYVLVATDITGSCTTVVEIEVPGPGDFTSDYDLVLPENPDDSTGSITTHIAGGTPPYQYLWSTGNTSVNLIGVPEGVYFLTVTDANGCVFIEPVKLDFPIGIGENDGMLSVKVYPNPSTGKLNLKSDQKISSLRIYDMSGRIIVQERVPSAAEEISLDLDDFNSGLYILEVERGQILSRHQIQLVNEN